MYEKYGEDHVSQIIAFGTLGAKAAIRDTGRAMGMSYADVDAVATKIPRVLGITLEDALLDADFKAKYGVDGTIISAVDLLKGIAKCAGMAAPDVEGATGYIDTNFEGKANAAIQAFESGVELVYLHLEGPDEHGHRGEALNKKLCIRRGAKLFSCCVLGGRFVEPCNPWVASDLKVRPYNATSYSVQRSLG